MSSIQCLLVSHLIMANVGMGFVRALDLWSCKICNARQSFQDWVLALQLPIKEFSVFRFAWQAHLILGISYNIRILDCTKSFYYFSTYAMDETGLITYLGNSPAGAKQPSAAAQYYEYECELSFWKQDGLGRGSLTSLSTCVVVQDITLSHPWEL